MATPLISVIVPIYNVEKYLDECVKSILGQTYENLEIILVDDGSPDNCPQKCDEWSKRDHRIKVVHKANGGLSSARNAGIAIAKGDFIGFVDSDDYIAENMYQELLLAIENSDKGIACCSAFRVSEDGKCLSRKNVPEQKVMDVNQALNSIFYMQADVSVWSKLYKREVFEQLRFPEGETNEDFPLIVPTITAARGMVHVRQCLYFYRMRTGSITNTGYISEAKSKLLSKNLQLIKEQLRDRGLESLRSYRYFSAQFAFFRRLIIEKNYPLLSDKVKHDNKVYRKIMKDNAMAFVCSRYSKLKEKILYLLVLTRLLRPLCKLLNRECL